MESPKKISSSNTKAEIIKAYQDLVKGFQQEKLQNTKLQKEIEKQKSMVQKVSEQNQLINDLTAKADHSGSQVKEIALKAIENSRMGNMPFYPERERREEKE